MTEETSLQRFKREAEEETHNLEKRDIEKLRYQMLIHMHDYFEKNKKRQIEVFSLYEALQHSFGIESFSKELLSLHGEKLIELPRNIESWTDVRKRIDNGPDTFLIEFTHKGEILADKVIEKSQIFGRIE